ncbi:unnamed protein product [Calicophoron daubneyi]|uniref:Tetraspanin n=1 Tax=Calicophoron daubneyi TaxID=300641 RepID=A0AAV2SZQ0_CALDB
MDVNTTSGGIDKIPRTRRNFPSKIVLIVGSGVCVIIGFTIFTIGCLLTWSETLVEGYVKKQMKNYLEAIKMGGNKDARVHILEGLLEYTMPMGQSLFWVGLSMMGVCSAGLYGAISRKRFALFVVSAILFAKVCTLLVILIAYHANPKAVLENSRKITRDKLLRYRQMYSADPDSLLLGMMMPDMKCCGLDGGEDFAGSLKFNRRMNTGTKEIHLRYPVVCCKMNEHYKPIYDSCPELFDESNSNIQKGCWPIIQSRLQYAYSRIAILVSITTLFEFFIACLGIYITMWI